jgi:hypothetical protein
MTKDSQTTKSPGQIAMLIRDRAINLLAPVKGEIEYVFKDADYRRIMWLGIIEQAKKFADEEERKLNAG